MASQQFQFGKQMIGKDAPCFVIAEIGINHEGHLDECMKMVRVCAEAGANAIKLQTSDPAENYHPSSESYKIYEAAYLGPEDTGKIFEYAKHLGMEAFTTTGLKTLDWVEKLNPSGYKISSGLFSHFYLIEEIVKKGRPVILSTGISTYDDIDQIVNIFIMHKLSEYAILQCTSIYPCPEDQLHLTTIPYIIQRYGAITGFSDHSISIEAPGYAVMCGAKIIEKHFTLDTTRTGFDHHISLNASQFKEMVQGIRRAERMLGNPAKILDNTLKTVKARMARYLFAANDLEKGQIITPENLLFLRSGDPHPHLVHAGDYRAIIGKRLANKVNYLDPLALSDVENKS